MGRGEEKEKEGGREGREGKKGRKGDGRKEIIH